MKKRPSNNRTNPSTFPNEQLMNTPANGAWKLIALKAYELYEQRGREDGHALEDWLTAEAIITKHD